MGCEQQKRRLPGRQIGELRWFFGSGKTLMEPPSSAGSTLDRAATFDTREQQTAIYREWAAAQRELVALEVCGAGMLEWEPPITARITNETKASAVDPENEESLLRAAAVSSQLVRLRRVRADGYSVLALAYGEGSEVWGSYGFGLGGLYQLGAAGKRLIHALLDERASAGAKLRIQLPHLMSNDQRAAEHVEDAQRIGMYGAAAGEAEKLLGDVAEVWNSLHGVEGE